LYNSLISFGAFPQAFAIAFTDTSWPTPVSIAAKSGASLTMKKYRISPNSDGKLTSADLNILVIISTIIVLEFFPSYFSIS